MEVLTDKTAPGRQRLRRDSKEYHDREAQIKQWYPLIYHVLTTRFSHLYGSTWDEAKQAGAIGLWHACINYNKNKKQSNGADFKTYAYRCIWGSIRRALQPSAIARLTVNLDGDMDTFVTPDKPRNEYGEAMMRWLREHHQKDQRLYAVYCCVHGETLKKISGDLDISHEWARQLYKKGLELIKDVYPNSPLPSTEETPYGPQTSKNKKQQRLHPTGS